MEYVSWIATALTASELFLQQVRAAHAALGIASDYMQSCALPLCPEPAQLVAAELDYYQRPQQLTPAALAAWHGMKQAAARAGVTLFLISAYRSVQYQSELIAKKLQKGQTMQQILSVNAAPGFSEHHTGRALDMGTTDCPALVEEFENTKAFQWLEQNAMAFGFHLSYPRDNAMGIDYEPWHWCFQGQDQQSTQA